MADAVAVGAILNAAGLELGDHLGDVHGDGTQLGVGHEATGTKDLTDAANFGHHVGGSDSSVEVDLAALDGSDELIGTDDVGAGLFSLASLLALGEDGDADGLAGAVGQGDGTADVLVGLTGIDTKAEVDLDGLVELSGSELLHEVRSLKRGVELIAADLLGSGAVVLTMMLSHCITSCGSNGHFALPHRACLQHALIKPK